MTQKFINTYIFTPLISRPRQPTGPEAAIVQQVNEVRQANEGRGRGEEEDQAAAAAGEDEERQENNTADGTSEEAAVEEEVQQDINTGAVDDAAADLPLVAEAQPQHQTNVLFNVGSIITTFFTSLLPEQQPQAV